MKPNVNSRDKSIRKDLYRDKNPLKLRHYSVIYVSTDIIKQIYGFIIIRLFFLSKSIIMIEQVFYFLFFFLHCNNSREGLCMQTSNRIFFPDIINLQPNNFVDSHDEEGVYLFMPQNSNTWLTKLKHGYRLGK